jgi:hypothetical protein
LPAVRHVHRRHRPLGSRPGGVRPVDRAARRTQPGVRGVARGPAGRTRAPGGGTAADRGLLPAEGAYGGGPCPLRRRAGMLGGCQGRGSGGGGRRPRGSGSPPVLPRTRAGGKSCARPGTRPSCTRMRTGSGRPGSTRR